MREDSGWGESRSIEFTSRDLRLIEKALPNNANQRRLRLLPDIIHDWVRIDLPRLFSMTPEPVEVRMSTTSVLDCSRPQSTN
jgi:hypothetical protein